MFARKPIMSGCYKNSTVATIVGASLMVLAAASTAHAQGAIHDPNSYTSLGTLSPSSNVTVNTSGANPSMTGGFTGVVDNGVAVFTFDSVDVPASVTFTVSGARPLVILSQGSFVFAGTLNANATGSAAGPGGWAGNSATAGGNGFGPGGGEGDIFGGGGGGFGGQGGNSFDEQSQQGSYSAGGPTYGNLATSLQGGSGGGRSTWSQTTNDGDGGGGGGAVEFGSDGSLSVSGSVNARGAAGFNGATTAYDGGGGGSGGGIILHSVNDSVTLTGTLDVRGGNGGHGEYGAGGGGGGRIYFQGTSITRSGNELLSGGAGGTSYTTNTGLQATAGGAGTVNQNVISPANNPPTVSNGSVSMNWNTTYTFSLAEFEAQFSDPDPSDQLEELRIVTLPSDGTLEFQNAAITAAQLPFDIDRNDIGDLDYIPDTNFSGSDSFEYNASDGTVFANDTADVNITVNFVNTPPTVDDVNIVVGQNTNYTFSLSEFEAQFTDPDPNHQLEQLRILSLPSDGDLHYQGAPFTVPFDIDRNDIGGLAYLPDTNYVGPDSFQYNASDGIDFANTPANVNIDVQFVNTPPTIDDLQVTLNENSSHAFTLAEFETQFTDPDPGHILEELRIVTLPANGVLELDGVEIEAAQLPFDIDRGDVDDLVYVPGAYFNGADVFEYNASDGIDFSNNTAFVNITVDPFNNAPVLDNSGEPWLNTAFVGVQSPQGTSVPTLLSRAAGGDPITDADAIDPRGIAIIDADSTFGDWEYTLDGGQNWANFNNVAEDNALLLDDSEDVQIRFNTTAFTGTIDPAIEFRAWDQYEGSNGDFYDIPANGGTGGMNAFSVESETASIEVNLPPEIAIAREGTPILDGGIDNLGVVAPLVRQRLSYTVRNVGAGPLSLTGTPRVELTDLDNATAFLIVVPDSTIPTNGRSAMGIHLTPQATGPFSVTVTVPNDDPDKFNYTFTIEGEAGNLASVALEHDGTFLVANTQLDIGLVSTQIMRSLQFNVHNLGAADLGDIDVVLGSQTNVSAVIDPNVGQSSLAPSQSTSFNVDLRPQSSGSFSLYVRVLSDDPTTPEYIIPITGQATGSTSGRLEVQRLPGVLLPGPDATDDIGYLLLGSPTALVWELHNIGFSTVGGITTNVTNESNAVANIFSSPSSVSAGNASNVNLTIEPLSAGPFSLILHIESNDSRYPSREVLVIGEGTNSVEPRLTMYGESHEPVRHEGETPIPRYYTGIDTSYPFVIANQGTAPLAVSIPVQLGRLVNCNADIIEQPDAGPTLMLQPQGYAVVRTSMHALDESDGARFDVLVTSNDPMHPIYRITAVTEGPRAGGTPSSKSRGCALGVTQQGAGTVQWLLFTLLLFAMLVARRRVHNGH